MVQMYGVAQRDTVQLQSWKPETDLMWREKIHCGSHVFDHTFYIYGPFVKKMPLRFLKDGLVKKISNKL